MFGPGKYDDLCTEIRERTGSTAVVLLIADGNKGPGFSVQATFEMLLTLPNALDELSNSIRADLKARKS